MALMKAALINGTIVATWLLAVVLILFWYQVEANDGCLEYQEGMSIRISEFGNCQDEDVKYNNKAGCEFRHDPIKSELIILTPDKCLDEVFSWSNCTAKLMKLEGRYKFLFNIFHGYPAPTEKEIKEWQEFQCINSSSFTAESRDKTSQMGDTVNDNAYTFMIVAAVLWFILLMVAIVVQLLVLCIPMEGVDSLQRYFLLH